jgi:FKBP-type peptidyl-prolyl cis-trans isomerase FkpA
MWRVVAIISLVSNLVFLAWLWHASAAPHGAAQVKAAAPLVQADSRKATRPYSEGEAPYAALGSFMAENNRIPDLHWTTPQFAAFQEGFRASYEGRGLPLDDDAKHLRDEISKRVQSMLAGEQPNPMEDYFRTLREKENVQRTASGLHYRITDEGFGSPPTAADTIVLSFSARLPDGTTLPPLSRTRVKMAVRDLLPGLAEGVQLLRVGGKALVYLPPQLAFSADNWPPQIPKGTPLAFFLELHEIVGAAR